MSEQANNIIGITIRGKDFHSDIAEFICGRVETVSGDNDGEEYEYAAVREELYRMPDGSLFIWGMADDDEPDHPIHYVRLLNRGQAAAFVDQYADGDKELHEKCFHTPN